MINVAIWAIGGVAKAAAPVVFRHPRMKLVGAYTMSADKNGVDLGTLCGDKTWGVRATTSKDEILALKPDCVLYFPLFPDTDDMVAILEAGINIVSTAYFIDGSKFPPGDQQRIADAAQRGKASAYGSGINPGLANILGLVSSSICADVRHITILESVDSTPYASPGTWEKMGVGREPGEPGIDAFISQSTPSFHEAVHMMAGALGVTLDRIGFKADFATATKDVDLDYMKVGKGKILSVRGNWTGWVNGAPFIDFKVAWKIGTDNDPDWEIEHGYVVEIEGNPHIRCKLEPVGTDVFDPGLITAMPAVHAIPLVCAAPPGIVTANELPMIVASNCV